MLPINPPIPLIQTLSSKTIDTHKNSGGDSMKRLLAVLALAAATTAAGCQGVGPRGNFAGGGRGGSGPIATSRSAPRPNNLRQDPCCQQCSHCDGAGCGSCVGDSCVGGAVANTCAGCPVCEAGEDCQLFERYCGSCNECGGGGCYGGCGTCGTQGRPHQGYQGGGVVGAGRGILRATRGSIQDMAAQDNQYNFNPGPPVGQTAYPYYTTRGPRDFLNRNPPSIGPY